MKEILDRRLDTLDKEEKELREKLKKVIAEKTELLNLLCKYE